MNVDEGVNLDESADTGSDNRSKAINTGLPSSNTTHHSNASIPNSGSAKNSIVMRRVEKHQVDQSQCRVIHHFSQ